jgi:5-carboxyvanillate decarboxylase
MIAVAPQDPAAAAKEIERGVTKLGMHSVIINSHTQGEYLSDSKFWDIFAAAEAHGMCRSTCTPTRCRAT